MESTMTDYEPDRSDYAFDPDEDDDAARNVGAFLYMAQAADNLLQDPPGEMKGLYFDEQRGAWTGEGDEEEGALRRKIDELAKYLSAAGYEAMETAGLVGRAGKAKCRQVRDAIREFLKLRSGPRAAKMLKACVYLLASMVSLVPGIEAIKEAFEGFKYLTDMAVAGA
jgi:hypothetical protein